ncbi:AcrR family transcriptional regulator [Bradyrhizobium sp. JR6.1]
MTTSTLKMPRAPKTRTATGPVEVRAGRPPKELAGEVDARILDAAREVFLERGFEGASIDEIAEAARSGKRTIYARFRDKRALFTEVVTRDILSRIAEFKADAPLGATVEERLTSVASTLLHWGLDADRIGLMRLAIAEARRFPDLAATVNRRARALATELGVHLLRDLTRSDGNSASCRPSRRSTCRPRRACSSTSSRYRCCCGLSTKSTSRRSIPSSMSTSRAASGFSSRDAGAAGRMVPSNRPLSPVRAPRRDAARPCRLPASRSA